jgi:hypothetical protein
MSSSWRSRALRFDEARSSNIRRPSVRIIDPPVLSSCLTVCFKALQHRTFIFTPHSEIIVDTPTAIIPIKTTFSLG